MSDPIFTRYLYEKNGVIDSLQTSILSKRSKEALFWVYELWFSGFEKEAWDLLIGLYRDAYQSANPRFAQYLTRSNLPIDIGTATLTLCYRSTSLSNVRFILLMTENRLESYKTRTGNVLSIVSTYSIAPLPHDIQEAYLGPDWLYYCRNTPIWTDRIRQHGGMIDDETKQIVFSREDDLEDFYDIYGLEPDEQSLEIHEKHGVFVYTQYTNVATK